MLSVNYIGPPSPPIYVPPPPSSILTPTPSFSSPLLHISYQQAFVRHIDPWWRGGGADCWLQLSSAQSSMHVATIPHSPYYTHFHPHHPNPFPPSPTNFKTTDRKNLSILVVDAESLLCCVCLRFSVYVRHLFVQRERNCHF